MAELKMPALSPTMEKGTLAKWLVKVGDKVNVGDMVAEIETDKATMELEAEKDGLITSLVVAEGTDGVAVGTVIAILAGEGENLLTPIEAAPSPKANSATAAVPIVEPMPKSQPAEAPGSPLPASVRLPRGRPADPIKVSPLAARIAEAQGIDLGVLTGSGPNGRIVRSDLCRASQSPPPDPVPAPLAAPPAPAAINRPVPAVPHELAKLSSMRKTIARRLTESKQQVPHIYLTVDVRLDTLLSLRERLNAALMPRGIKISVNDLVIKALAQALTDVPQCNVQFTGDSLARFKRVDVSVAVSIPGGLITPIVTDASSKSLSAIAAEMADLAGRAREGKLRPEEFQGGTASLSNLGMYGIKQFEAVINPPQGMILAVGTGERRHVVNDDDCAEIATVLSATGSFDHRAIDGADAALLMQAFRGRIENPLTMIV